MLVQPITIKNYQKSYTPRFKGNNQIVQEVVEKTQPAVREKITKPFGEIIINSIKDISNFLKANVAKIENGKIFNVPITPSDNSLLNSLVNINDAQAAENEDAYLAVLFKMSQMEDIDYNQKDSIGITFLEKVIMSENKNLLKLIKNKNIDVDFDTIQNSQNVKDPEFRKLFIETKAYKDFMDFRRNTITKFSSSRDYNADRYDYSDEDLNLIREYVNLLNYDSAENKEEILNALNDLAINIAGEYIDLNGYTACLKCKNADSNIKKIKSMFNLYKITDYNKNLFKDLLIKIFSNEKGWDTYSMHLFATFMPILTIFKDSPDDFIDIFISTKNRRFNSDSITLYMNFDQDPLRLYRELEILNPSEEKLKKFDKHLKKLDYPPRKNTLIDEINTEMAKIEQDRK